MKYGYFMCDHSDELHVVLDDNQRMIAFKLVNKLSESLHLLLRHASCGFVEKDEIRLRRRYHSYFYQLSLTVREPTHYLL